MTIKNVEQDFPIYKARFVVQGHRDSAKASLEPNTTTICQNPVRLIASIAASLNWRIWTHDVNQAYLPVGTRRDRARCLTVGPTVKHRARSRRVLAPSQRTLARSWLTVEAPQTTIWFGRLRRPLGLHPAATPIRRPRYACVHKRPVTLLSSLQRRNPWTNRSIC